MQGFTVTAIINAEKTKTSKKMSNFDINVDGRTNGRTEIWTPISHPAISRCDKNQTLPFVVKFYLQPFSSFSYNTSKEGH